MSDSFSIRGFLPLADPCIQFGLGSRYCLLDDIGHDLPSRLLESDFRSYAKSLSIPQWFETASDERHLPELQLYFLRLSFLASGYINQVGQPSVSELPANIAVPLVHSASLLGVPPILNYAAYALVNWKRFDPSKDVVLGNIDTIQNFVHLYDEHWFILIHVEIEAQAASVLKAVQGFHKQIAGTSGLQADAVNAALSEIGACLEQQLRVLKRIPERMSPELYFHTFRPYIRFFEGVEYCGVSAATLAGVGVGTGASKGRVNYRGETGAQSSIMPVLINLLKIEHKPSILVDHLMDIRQYMPPSHREFIERTAKLPNIKALAKAEIFDRVLELMAQFREVHLNWAVGYINKHVKDPRGTGGTPYMQWLQQLIDETRGHKNSSD